MGLLLIYESRIDGNFLATVADTDIFSGINNALRIQGGANI